MKECVSRIHMSTQCSATTKFFGAKVAELHNFYMSLVIIFIYKKLVTHITPLVLMNTLHVYL